MMLLLVDIGNTRIKWALDKQGLLIDQGVIAYKQSDLDRVIQSQWSHLDRPYLLAIASVSHPELTQTIELFAKQQWSSIQIFIAHSSQFACQVTNGYQYPERLGVDRWLALIALHHYYPDIQCVVDCGTAITIDCLDSSGQHLGGLISAGLQLMQQSLSQGTVALSTQEVHSSMGLADMTDTAIYSGTVYAAAGLIEKVVNNLSATSQLVLTGGDAELIASLLNLHIIIEPNFVLKGLSLLAQESLI